MNPREAFIAIYGQPPENLNAHVWNTFVTAWNMYHAR